MLSLSESKNNEYQNEFSTYYDNNFENVIIHYDGPSLTAYNSLPYGINLYYSGEKYNLSKITEENLLSKEEIMKIEEIVESSTKQLKNELILTSKEVKLKVEFLLDEGSFVFSKQNKDIVESFSFKYKKLYFNMKKGENFNELEAYLKDFVIDMITTYKNNEVKTSQITYHDKDKILVNKNDMIVNIDEDYVWKLEFLIFGPGEKINSDLNLHIVIKFLFFLNIF